MHELQLGPLCKGAKVLLAATVSVKGLCRLIAATIRVGMGSEIGTMRLPDAVHVGYLVFFLIWKYLFEFSYLCDQSV